MLGLPALDPLTPELLSGIEPAHAGFVIHGLYNRLLAGAKAFREPNVARANHVAAPAFNAVEQSEILKRFESLTRDCAK